MVFVKTSAAKPTVSPNVGWGCIVKLKSSASAPISIANTASDIKSPAPEPTIPTPRTLLLSGENNIFVFPFVEPTADARPLAAQGNSPFSYDIFFCFAYCSVSPAQATSGSVYTTLGMAITSNADGTPAQTSAATFPW